jgi:hypothetical protein
MVARLICMTPPARQKLIEQIHACGDQFVLSITGGGSGAIAALLEVPGASASVLEAVVPYSATALQRWLGGPAEQYCSERTARAMAMAGFERARQLVVAGGSPAGASTGEPPVATSDADPRILRGIGATASLATTRPKRGAHRIHVAWQSAAMTAVASCELAKGQRTRAEEEHIATQLILDAVAESCEVDAQPLLDPSLHAQVQRRQQQAPASWTELLLGSRTSVMISENRESADERSSGVHKAAPAILFPGAFNPPHWGHERMAEIADQRYGRPVTFELSITNVDKPPLDFIEISDRIEQLAGRRVLLTRAPTFVEKARLAPRCVFVVGSDTLERIADPSYYDGDAAKRDAAISEIAAIGCRFLVFGRTLEEQFMPLSAVNFPEALRALCEEVPESEFRADISSTKLRGQEID